MSTRISDEVKKELTDLKYFNKESFDMVIKRLIEENKSLRIDKQLLFQVALKSEGLLESDMFIVYAFIVVVLKNTAASVDEKLGLLEYYLQQYIESDSSLVLDAIAIVEGTMDLSDNVLDKFKNYVMVSA